MLFLLDGRAAQAQVHQIEAQLARDRAQLDQCQARCRSLRTAGRQGFRLAPAIRHRRDQRRRRSRRRSRPTRRRSRTSRCCSPTTRSRRRSMGGSARSASRPATTSRRTTCPLTINQIEADLCRLLAAAERFPGGARGDGKRAPSRSTSLPPGDSEAPDQGTRRILRQRGRHHDRHDRAQARCSTIPEERLWPGQFVNVSVTSCASSRTRWSCRQPRCRSARTAPMSSSSRRTTPPRCARSSMSRTIAGKSVIAKGLEPGEQVVTDGQLRLTNGSRVEIHSADAPEQAR